MYTLHMQLVPLAGAVQRLLEVVVDQRGVAGAEQRDRPGLEAALPAALTEAGVAVDVEVKYGGRRTFTVAGIHRHLR